MSFYGKRAPNQMVGAISNPCSGLSNLMSPNMISDNHLSDCLDLMPAKADTVSVFAAETVTSVDLPFSAKQGQVLDVICDQDAGIDYLYTLSYRKYTGTYSQTGTTVTVTMESHNIPSGVAIYCDCTTGNGDDGKFTITGTTVDTLTYTSTTSETASGNISIYRGFIHKIQMDGTTPATVTELDITSLNYPTGSPLQLFHSSALFATETTNYVVFCCSGIQRLFYYDGSTTGSVSLPFYPKKLVSHANRIFAVDTKNKLWWSKAGSFNASGSPSADWYGGATGESSVVEDAGYWTIEKERVLSGIGLLGNTLYIFGSQNIYSFMGYDYDTFALQVAIPDYGIESTYNSCRMSQTGTAIYFMRRGEEGIAEVFEFDGTAAPVIINKSIIINEQIQNGLLGGVSINYSEYTHMSSNNNYLYVYEYARGTAAGDSGEVDSTNQILYVYDTKQRTWWKRSGFYATTIPSAAWHSAWTIDADFSVLYTPSLNKSKTYAVVSSCGDTEPARNWAIFYDSVVGLTNTMQPYLITKAFTSLPSDRETLTSLVFQFQGVTAGSTISLKFSVSTTMTGSFSTVAYQPNYKVTGGLESIEVFLPITLVHNAKVYRIKMEAWGGSCYLHNIERRYRTKGRSR